MKRILQTLLTFLTTGSLLNHEIIIWLPTTSINPNLPPFLNNNNQHC